MSQITIPSHTGMIWTVFKRNLLAYFINPTGYVFITVFILLGAMAAFWQGGFFLNNLANLDQLNFFFPMLLLFFVPALTMNIWSDERRQGTDELLFTLPAHDLTIVLGKYLAVLGIYTVAVLFSLSHVCILAWLGDPDLGLMAATYFGYWLAGGAMLAVGMVASVLTRNATVAFILGAAMCGVLVFLDTVDLLFGGDPTLLRQLGLRPHFASFGQGIVSTGDVFYFVAVATIMLYVNASLIARRHFGGGTVATQTTHRGVRAVMLVIGAIGLGVLVQRWGPDLDVTAERLHSLQAQTSDIVADIPDDRPVFIQAFFSPDVPRTLVATRKNLVNLLERFDRMGGDRVRVSIVDTEPFSEAATTASENYRIQPRAMVTVEGGQRSTEGVYLGLVFTSGPEEFVIPFFEPGLPVEYELARSLQVVTQVQRRTVGVVATDAKVFGGFDFQSGTSSADWSFVQELRKQYDVAQVAPTGPYPPDLDALVVLLPSSLVQPEQDALRAAIQSGIPTLLFVDPLPRFRPALAPSLKKDAGRNPFTSQNQPPAPDKGDLGTFLAGLGIEIPTQSVVWSDHNPHPMFADLPPEYVFVTADTSGDTQGFAPDSPITSGLQEMVFIYPGRILPTEAPGFEYTPLITMRTPSGTTLFSRLVQQSLLGIQVRNDAPRAPTNVPYDVAMHVRGPGTTSTSLADGPPAPVTMNVIAIADSDVVSEGFFSMRRRGSGAIDFDNVTFAMNCIDVLVGDSSFISLRKRRPLHRTLKRFEKESDVYTAARREEIDAAETEAETRLADAQKGLKQKVDAIKERDDLDTQTRNIMVRSVERAENRRMSVIARSIQQEKERRIARAGADANLAIAAIQRRIKWWAALLPPIPPLILGIVMWISRARRERLSVSERQLVRSA